MYCVCVCAAACMLVMKMQLFVVLDFIADAFMHNENGEKMLAEMDA